MILLSLCAALMVVPTRDAPVSARQYVAVGWADELNSLSGWVAREGGMKADVYSDTPGAMTLRLAHAPDGFPYSYQWGGVTREVSVDLGRYPVLVARVLDISPRGY